VIGHHKLRRNIDGEMWLRQEVTAAGQDRGQIRIYEGSAARPLSPRRGYHCTIVGIRVTTTHGYLYHLLSWLSFAQYRQRCYDVASFFSPLPFLSLLLVLSDRSATVVALCRCSFSSLSVCRRSIHTRYFLISFRLPRLHR